MFGVNKAVPRLMFGASDNYLHLAASVESAVVLFRRHAAERIVSHVIIDTDDATVEVVRSGTPHKS